ncbi:MAG TPA: ATP-binding protein [Thermoanaerobaculia bacterium]|nr:ATP-binding protein [Thermoanaerobaculia bacterium]
MPSLKGSSAARLSSAQRQLEVLRREAARGPDPEKIGRQLDTMQEQLAGLEVAYVELEQQNEELQATREALELQRHRYLLLFEEAPFGYLVTDVNGKIEEANRAAARLLGVRQDLLSGKPFAVYLEVDVRPSFRDLLHRVSAGETGGEAEVLIQSRADGPIPVVLTGVRDSDAANRTARLRWTIRDVSKTKQAEEALRASEERLRHSQRLEAVGRLAGGIAHSFNNLLAAISFQCELLFESTPAEDGRRAHIEEIQRAGERAAALARQLLAYGRKQTLQPRTLSLNDVIREMAPMLRRLIGEHIQLDIALDPQEGAVHVDLGQIEQVILNLAVNARDALRSGGILRLAAESLTVAAGEIADLPAGDYVQFTVADTGAGMPPEVMEHLFEPFFTTKARGEGSGLGLATVHGIVHQSGGQIRVESSPGQGAAFSILLPKAAGGSEVGPLRSTLPGRRLRRGSEVVLLVEDEDNIREPAVEILESRGYRVLSAADATQALKLSDEQAGPIHILVTDVVMPGLSGSQLAGQLVRRRPELLVLYISGYPEDSIAHHGVLSEDQHFLQKPFPPGQFLEKIRAVLDASRPG